MVREWPPGLKSTQVPANPHEFQPCLGGGGVRTEQPRVMRGNEEKGVGKEEDKDKRESGWGQ